MMTRGIKHEVDRFISDLQAQYFKYKFIPNDKRLQVVQLAVRPIQLWELVFPQESLNTVIATIRTQDYGYIDDKWMAVLRRMLKVKKIPPISENERKRIIHNLNVQVKMIGIKDDRIEGGIEKL